MSFAITKPMPHVCQVSGVDDDRRDILTVLAKETLAVNLNGSCDRIDPEPLFQEVVPDPDDEYQLQHDADVYPFKPMTDVVIRGSVFARSGERELTVSIRIGIYSRSINVFGPRRATLSSGRVVFSPPSKIPEKLELKWTHAYGGRDAVAEARYGNDAAVLAEIAEDTNADAASPYLYPRNPVGRGYLIEATPEAIEAVKLPFLEDPSDPLTPDRLAVRDIDQWGRAPLPACTCWTPHHFFPRIAYMGIQPFHGEADFKLAEVQRGWAPADILQTKEADKSYDSRFTNGAALGLQFPYLTGDETIEITHLSPIQTTFRCKLPGRRPKIWTDGRQGKMNEAKVVLYSLILEPSKNLVHLVWAGSAPALRPYAPDELERMPLKVEW